MTENIRDTIQMQENSPKRIKIELEEALDTVIISTEIETEILIYESTEILSGEQNAASISTDIPSFTWSTEVKQFRQPFSNYSYELKHAMLSDSEPFFIDGQPLKSLGYIILDGEKVPRCFVKGKGISLELTNDVGEQNTLTLLELMRIYAEQYWYPMPTQYQPYQFSSDGHIRRDPSCNWLTRDALIPDRQIDLYPRISLITRQPYRKQHCYVHCLVSLGTYGPIPEGKETGHLDDDPLDTSPAHLEYVTHAENMQKAKKNYQTPVLVWDATKPESPLPLFHCVKAAADHFGVNPAMIRNRCKNGTILNAKGQMWKMKFEGELKVQRRAAQKAPENLEWKPIPSQFHQGYECTAKGLFRRVGSSKMLVLRKVGNYEYALFNYIQVGVSIAMLWAWNGAPPGDPDQYDGDHIDQNTFHNCITNLRWLPKEINRSLSNSKPCQRQMNDGSWQSFDSQTEASKYLITEGKVGNLETAHRRLRRVCGTNKKAYGTRWRYMVQDPPSPYICPTCGEEFMRPGEWKAPTQ